MGTLTSSLIVKLVNQVTAPAKQVVSSIKGIGQSFAGLNGKNMLAGLDAAIKRNNDQLKAMKGNLLGALAAGYALKRALMGPLQAAMDFESAMADVKKVVDFDDLADFKKFQQDVLEMTTRIPMAGKELSNIVAEAGQSGIAKNELLKFTEMAAKVGVAFDISAREAGEALAKMKTGLALSIDETSKLADAMNHLSNNQASKARDVLDVVRRVGAMGKQFGFKPKDVAAFGSAMVAAGAQTEVASTSFMNMGRALTKGASATKRQRAAYQRLGLDAKKVAVRMQKDAVGTTLDVMERIGKMPAHLRSSIVSDLFGDEARALGPLLTNLPLLKNSLKLVADEQDYLGSAEKEYISRSATFANAVQLLKNRFERVGIAIGNSLFPPLTALMDKLSPLIDAIAKWAGAHPELVRNIVIATTALIGFKVASIGIRAASLLARGSILEMASSFLRFGLGVGRVGKGIGKGVLSPFRAFGRAIGSTRKEMKLINVASSTGLFSRPQVLGGQISAIGRNMLGFLNPMRLAKTALSGVGAALRGLRFLAGGSIIGMAAFAGFTWLSNNWKGLVQFVTSIGESFMNNLGPAKPIVEGIGSGIQSVFDWFNKLLGPVDESGQKWKGWGEAVGKALADAVNFMTQFVADAKKWLGDVATALANPKEMLAAGARMIQELWDGMKAKMGELMQWAADKAREIASKFTFGYISGPTPAGSSVNVPAQGGSLQGYAKGGHFSGGPMIVGEEGPELITATRSGYVHTADKTRRMFGGRNSAGGGAGGITFNLGGLSVSGVNDPRAIADQVISELQSRLGSALTGIQADLGYTS